MNNRRPKAAVANYKSGWLGEYDALGQRTTIAGFDVELHGLSLNERPTTLALNLRVVNKDVRLTINSDESPALFVVEPLDGSCSHCGPPYCFKHPEYRFLEGTTTATSRATLLGG